MGVSNVPLPAEFFHAILSVLASRGPAGIRRRDLYELVADQMGLSAEQRAERLPSLAHLRYRHRTGGQDLLGEHPTTFDDATKRSINLKARSLRGADPEDGGANTLSDADVGEHPPDERIEAALA